jgi:hypothetical protein
MMLSPMAVSNLRASYVLRRLQPTYFGRKGGMSIDDGINYDMWRSVWLDYLEVAYYKAFRENTP